MNKKISIYQFFIIMTIVPYGSASLFFIAPQAKQDEWIAILLYSLGGILLQLIYITLYRKYPNDTIVTYMPKIYGKFIGNIVGTAYVAYFTYISARVFRDFVELISAFSLEYTSRILFSTFFIIIIVYAVYNEIDNISSLAQLYFIIIIVVKISSFFLIIISQDNFKFYNLKPVMVGGVLDLLKKSWHIVTVPYGETVLFAMFYPMVIENQKIKKAAILSIFADAALLAINSITFICTLGVNFAISTNFPLLETYRLIDIGDFLSRLDIIVILVFLVDGFFKISIFLYGAVLGTSQILKLKSNKIPSIPLGIIVLVAALTMAKSYPQHIKTGFDYVSKYVHVPMQIIIPILTLIVCSIKNRGSNVKDVSKK
ncbi:GerAB/ArcD/ProY family transporter [Clostridium tyrobutyricum]|jgi:spore germination protein KB|uniref:GerAB/ArcD/ProY family transporter n=1 Tax=Clostridium tyrobutyricum TaxID=1519 RepID=UPI0005807635|nr:GerAB/ArcD/ProY family transporter [Clostridium tyrobutyricum]